mmetsp:Transcript_1599/g.3844  ORF Transcript_1599/g.3844 Transcript_1599/m.3844 type:complete len:715 (-) Transcript_1599:658-2802(-)
MMRKEVSATILLLLSLSLVAERVDLSETETGTKECGKWKSERTRSIQRRRRWFLFLFLPPPTRVVVRLLLGLLLVGFHATAIATTTTATTAAAAAATATTTAAEPVATASTCAGDGRTTCTADHSEPQPPPALYDGDENKACAHGAALGMCSLNPKSMFQRCPPGVHCLGRDDFGATVSFEIPIVPIESETEAEIERRINASPGGRNKSVCSDNNEDCEDLAGDHRCVTNPRYMLEECRKSCRVCFGTTGIQEPATITLPIGVKQRMPRKFFDRIPGEAHTDDDPLKESFYEVIAETHEYMVERVYSDPRLESSRRDCFNADALCAWRVATTGGTNGTTYCRETPNRLLCGPACKACGDLVLAPDELDLIEDCTPDESMDAFEDEEEEDESADGDERGASKQTIDAMFRRIVGELPYPPAGAGGGKDEDDYPIVPGVNYTARVLSRPSLDKTVHTNVSLDSIDFHFGGPWIVVLDDFLSEEECDRMIELGDLLGREASTIEDDEDEASEDEPPRGKDESKENDQDAREKEPRWRTSTTAWCEDEICRLDPVAQRVQRRIGLTTGVTDESYYEFLQLLKYVPGQYYKEHHDESGDFHDNQYDPAGPRILTFFLYLNDVEEGGETRFTDVLGDDSSLYIDVLPKKGRALLWPSMTNEDLEAHDARTYHAALEVTKGIKYGANAWLHLRDFRNCGCDEEDMTELLAKIDLPEPEGDH